CQKYSNPSLTF
nr:immunoglobulin light chain junction region [Macaca mulatta]